jgi:hypothetical protein
MSSGRRSAIHEMLYTSRVSDKAATPLAKSQELHRYLLLGRLDCARALSTHAAEAEWN